MDLSEEEKQISKDARDFIKDNKNLLIQEFANDENHPSQDEPVSIFTAGSFGAGKTEFSRQLARELPGIVLIDADEIRKLCPEYNGDKAYIFNSAAFIGQEKLHDYVLKQGKSFVFDSTFSNYEKAKQNIERSLSRSRPIEIYYVYQHPRAAWLFTKVRERIKGRFIPKEDFVDSFLQSKAVVSKIKEEFKDSVSLNLVEKSTDSDLDRVDLDDLEDAGLKELKSEIIRKRVETDIEVEEIDNYIDFHYSKAKLIENL